MCDEHLYLWYLQQRPNPSNILHRKLLIHMDTSMNAGRIHEMSHFFLPSYQSDVSSRIPA